MNRRDVLRTLMALPAATRISVAEVKSDDVIVIECPGRLSRSQQDAIAADLGNVWPGRRVVVLTDGMTFKIAKS